MQIVDVQISDVQIKSKYCSNPPLVLLKFFQHPIVKVAVVLSGFARLEMRWDKLNSIGCLTDSEWDLDNFDPSRWKNYTAVCVL